MTSLRISLVAGSAGDLAGQDVECLGRCQARAAVGQGHRDGVGGGRSKLSVHCHDMSSEKWTFEKYFFHH